MGGRGSSSGGNAKEYRGIAIQRSEGRQRWKATIDGETYGFNTPAEARSYIDAALRPENAEGRARIRAANEAADRNREALNRSFREAVASRSAKVRDRIDNAPVPRVGADEDYIVDGPHGERLRLGRQSSRGRGNTRRAQFYVRYGWKPDDVEYFIRWKDAQSFARDYLDV